MASCVMVVLSFMLTTTFRPCANFNKPVIFCENSVVDKTRVRIEMKKMRSFINEVKDIPIAGITVDKFDESSSQSLQG